MDRLGRSEEATAFERMLLESASEDVPSTAARARTLAALGVGAGAVATGAMAKAAQAATASAARGSVATGATSGGVASVAKSGSVAAGVLLKYLGAGAVAGLVTTGTLVVATAPPVAPTRVAAPAVSVVKNTAPAVERIAPESLRDTRAAEQPLPGPEPTLVAPTPEVGNVPAAAAARSERAAPSSPGISSSGGYAPPVFDASHVVEEVHSLDFARAALEASDPRTALSRLAAHDARFPRGTLEPEAVVLRVRALLALGRRPEAAAVAKAFLATHPQSAQAARLRTLVGP